MKNKKVLFLKKYDLGQDSSNRGRLLSQFSVKVLVKMQDAKMDAKKTNRKLFLQKTGTIQKLTVKFSVNCFFFSVKNVSTIKYLRWHLRNLLLGCKIIWFWSRYVMLQVYAIQIWGLAAGHIMLEFSSLIGQVNHMQAVTFIHQISSSKRELSWPP